MQYCRDDTSFVKRLTRSSNIHIYPPHIQKTRIKFKAASRAYTTIVESHLTHINSHTSDTYNNYINMYLNINN